MLEINLQGANLSYFLFLPSLPLYVSPSLPFYL